MNKSTVLTTAVVVGMAVSLTACGSSDSGTSPAAQTSSSGAASAAPAPTGEPIVLGMMNQENTPAGSFPEIRVADQAAVDYINKSMGGINGRPLSLETCITNGSPESSASCANQLVGKKPLVITSGIDFGTAASLPVFVKASLPYVGGIPLLPTELTSPDSFMFSGGSTSAFPAQAAYIAEEQKAKKVNVLYTDNPSGLAAATKYGQKVLESYGITDVKLTAEKADAADFTAAVTKVAQGSPDAVMVLFSGQGCSRIMQAAGSLGLTSKTKFYYPGSCAGSEIIKAGGSGAEGARFNTDNLLLNDSDPDIKVFKDAMKANAPAGASQSSFAQSGFSSVMNIAALLKGLPTGSVTSQGLVDALKATKDQHNFMSHPYTCDGKQVPGATSVCNAYDKMVENKSGTLQYLDNDWVKGADKLSAS